MKIKVYDIETLMVMFYYLDYDPVTKEYVEFEISENRNDLFKLVKYLNDLKSEGYYMVGYNNVQYDFNVLQHIYDNHVTLSEMSNLDIAKYISEYSSLNIKTTNSGGFPQYAEHEFLVDQIDLLKINHFDNENRRTSLKWLQYMMCWPLVEGMPVDFNSLTLNEADLEKVRKYCKNDVMSTHEFYLYTIGEVEHEFYKGNNQILNRMTIIKEGLLPKSAMNYADSKIGDELNKIAYAKSKGIDVFEIYSIRKKRKPTKKFTFGDAIPDYVTFKTPEFNAFFNMVKKERVRLLDDEQEYVFTYKGTTYVIAKGGIHSENISEIIIPKEDEYLDDSDVGAQYPNAIDKRGLYPSHLGPEWCGVMRNTIFEKDEYKQIGKGVSDPLEKLKWKGLETMKKLQMNGGGLKNKNVDLL